MNKRILKNGLATGLQKGVKICEQLLLVPFFISYWGAAYYGEWLTLTIIPSIIAFSDLGVGTAASNTFVLKYAAKNYQGASNISKTGFWLISFMIVCALIIAALTVFLLDNYDVFSKTIIDRRDAIYAVSILMLARLLNFYSQFYEGYYRAARRANVGINLLALNAALNVLAGLVVLLSGKGIIAFAASQLGVAVLFNLLFVTLANRQIKNLKSYKSRILRSDVKMIMNKGMGYLLSPVWQSIYFQGTTFAVRIILGPQAVAVFNTIRTLSRSVNQMYSLVSGAVFPELQYEVGLGNKKKQLKLFAYSLLAVFILAFVGFVFLAVFGLWFYNIWTQNELEVSNTVWLVFISGILFNSFWWTSAMVFRAVNRPYRFAMAGIIASIISVILVYFLSLYLGLLGAAIGNIALDFLLALIVLPLACKYLNISFQDLSDEFVVSWRTLKYKFKSKLE
ncbi:lipopolysaccharide biosynthesis protein [Leeuwenhoekiella parthenopeia]|uniref:Lipopolysaccharide biosynthesis protein n=1 Tax=Leeuwenhoekiella parthenopeia TaxID=2890320 RepID=A0ABS8GWG7_9FLAO|nr:lipopolysaccharide biosynthesis protein [Leeuwenhoekiella parthenopeia]MCC4214254.1 lipopolysaccharide biosynthesis protein [Leeuwenhoekiella parthenopeia]